MAHDLPELSRFELECLRRVWARGEASVRDVLTDLPDPPTYSTVKKILERLEEKGALTRVRLENRAWIYRSAVAAPAMIRKEIWRFVNALFDGSGAPLVQHLVEMNAVSLEDLAALDRRQRPANGKRASRGRRARAKGE
jgi:BlaI family penicillinase repressor